VAECSLLLLLLLLLGLRRLLGPWLLGLRLPLLLGLLLGHSILPTRTMTYPYSRR